MSSFLISNGVTSGELPSVKRYGKTSDESPPGKRSKRSTAVECSSVKKDNESTRSGVSVRIGRKSSRGRHSVISDREIYAGHRKTSRGGLLPNGDRRSSRSGLPARNVRRTVRTDAMINSQPCPDGHGAPIYMMSAAERVLYSLGATLYRLQFSTENERTIVLEKAYSDEDLVAEAGVSDHGELPSTMWESEAVRNGEPRLDTRGKLDDSRQESG